MPNPLFGNKTTPNGATAPNDSLNESYKRYSRGYNRFNLTRQFYNTERYADINLIEVLEGVENDKLPFGNRHEIRSHTLKSPIMFDVYKKKTYFMVDNHAILPLNWEKVYKQPNKGDDVDVSVNCVSNILYSVWNFLSQIRNSPNSITFNRNNYNYIFRVLLVLESIFSNGSLLASMNCHLSPMLYVVDDDENPSDQSFDSWFDELIGSISFQVLFPSISSNRYFCTTQPVGIHYFRPRRVILDMMRTFPDFNIYYSDDHAPRFSSIIDALKRLRFRFDISSGDVLEQSQLNLSRLIAYQLVCAQFYTRDSVDNIYTSSMFLDNAKSTISSVIGRAYTNNNDISPIGNYWPYFTYNGTKYEYDVFSGAVMDTIFSRFFNLPWDTFITWESNAFNLMYNYIHMIFFYRKSLRYGDYFVGAKTLPYAPADVTADVVGNGVSALDITRSILMQRFANAVERVSNTWKDYISGVNDGVAAPDVHEPRFLASSTSRVGGFEVENTSNENQGNIVTILKSGDSKYMYEVEVGQPCIIIGVSTYEIPRIYSRTLDKFFKHFDRFDMFNKFMQNIGDQEITMSERSSSFSPARVFGFTPRHMEYKQRYPIASGGFVEYLPGYAFITDNNESEQNDIDFSDSALHISSYFLRNRNSEFDRFYSSLTGCSLASYFHFICKYDLICDAHRQMEYSPSIL